MLARVVCELVIELVLAGKLRDLLGWLVDELSCQVAICIALPGTCRRFVSDLWLDSEVISTSHLVSQLIGANLLVA